MDDVECPLLNHDFPAVGADPSTDDRELEARSSAGERLAEEAKEEEKRDREGDAGSGSGLGEEAYLHSKGFVADGQLEELLGPLNEKVSSLRYIGDLVSSLLQRNGPSYPHYQVTGTAHIALRSCTSVLPNQRN